ncbi:Inositolphosphorylceramide synthase subunit Kei1-domain-containing protein [Podospora fimiseda]|uniref:Inositolphosphorylceramide synthase subunit Kei1-domain-containing protein n=1 Tax=Podospora fimiseda TaxID=252190 RepID=A0AAN7BYZ7_9PEZI|nr:Inositolphosphorylceramide synthase subunit Kei1-domain-containing protein [Podospora fimiseda]
MISRSSYLRPKLPRPRSFFGFLSLETGTELIALSLLFNKATGIYGLLTLVTGYWLSALQFTNFLISIGVIVTLAFCIPQIRKQSPFHNLLLAWVYTVDALVSAVYTAAFATSWYLALANGADWTKPPSTSSPEPAMIAIERRDAMAAPAQGDPDVAFSMVLIVGFTLLRLYFSLVVMAYARAVILRFVDERIPESEEDDEDGAAPNPFAEGAPLGEGWQGKSGRFMVSVGKGFWLGGRKEDEEWARGVRSKFRSSRE